MKTITRTINLYTFDELSKEAKERALQSHRETNEYYFLEDCMANRLHELLEENGIKDMNDTSKPGTTPTPVMYSLSYCQGDGAMFEGAFEWKGYTITIKHSGRYHHYNSKDITINDEEGNDINGQIYEDFNALYIDICKELERYGYDFIEYEDSEENFAEQCESNGFTFTSDGVMENE